MDLSRLSAFVVLSEELNFRKAADRLGMSQPPLTRLIGHLEDELETQLFERTTRRVSLTAAGLLLYREAKTIFASIEKVEAEIRAVGKMKKGILKAGFSQTAFLARLPKIIDEFCERLPGVKFDLQQASAREIQKSLRSGKLDVGFIEGAKEAEGLNGIKVADEVMGVLLPKKHRLSSRQEIDFAELKDETLIVHPQKENAEFSSRLKQLCSAAKIHPKFYVKNQEESCPILVATGRGVSLTIASARGHAFEETRFVPIKSLFLPVSVYWREDNQNSALKSFISVVSENHLFRAQDIECLTEVRVDV